MIRIKGARKFYKTQHGLVEAMRDIDLDVADGEFCVLLGPSGCGKTTTLRCVAGLEKPDDGEIEISGMLVSSSATGLFLATEKRKIGMVFQSYAIWPHMNVFENVAFPLTRGRTRLPNHLVVQKVHEVLRLVQLNGLENRSATDLSGGQQQRVAMARAIVTEPKILLMDEPLSNLDARLREQMRLELKKITKSVGVTTLYVTHDQAEALSLGDRICVMNEGRIVQIGSPQEIYSRPRDLCVAQFVGEMNFIEGRVVGPFKVKSPLGEIRCDLPSACASGTAVTLAIRPEHLRLADFREASEECVMGRIISKNYLGDAVLFEVEVGTLSLKAKLPEDSNFSIGQSVLVLPADRWQVYF